MEGGTGINFEHWSNVATIAIWEAAAMMFGADPRALQSGYVGDRNGEVPDLSDTERQLTSAVLAGELEAPGKTMPAAPDRNSHVLLVSLIEWFRNHGHAKLVHGFECVGATGASPAKAEANRRLSRLRSLGGDCIFDKMSDKWKITGLKTLRAEEEADGRGRVSDKTLRGDLISAAESERDALRAGKAPLVTRS